METPARAAASFASRFRPGKVVAFKPTDQLVPELEEAVPLLARKNDQGGVTTYICRDFTCQAPVVGAASLERALQPEAPAT